MTDKRIEILAKMYGLPYDIFVQTFSIVSIDKALILSERFAEMAFTAGRIMGVDVDHGFPCTYFNFKDWIKQQTEGGSNE